VSESNSKLENCRYILCIHFSSQFWFWLYDARAETGLETDFVSYSGTTAAFFQGRTRQLSAGSSFFWWAVGVSFNKSI
jgi:hypothetical protein